MDDDGDYMDVGHDGEEEDEGDDDEQISSLYLLSSLLGGGFFNLNRARQQNAQRLVNHDEEDEKQRVEFANSDFAVELGPLDNSRSFSRGVDERELEGPFSWRERVAMCSNRLPVHGREVSRFAHQLFSAKYSPNGELFASSCQDGVIRLHDATDWRVVRRVEALDVSWAILDTDFSPDMRWLVYCSWSDKMRLVNAQGDVETHQALDLSPPGRGRFCLFSVKFSPDSSEIIGGSVDNCVYGYDLVGEKRTFRLPGHVNDVNAVCYRNDGSSFCFFSGSDDCLIKMWDKRVGNCVGSFSGHCGGITCLDSRDEVYLASNSKDQTVKLWDTRKMGATNAEPYNSAGGFDYRMGLPVRALLANSRHPNDLSLMTYRGHSVLQTLIRCYFSPKETTGGRFLYSGSFDGALCIWDAVSGELTRVRGHRGACRDVSWHPFLPIITSVSWDGTIRCSSVSPDVDMPFLEDVEDGNERDHGDSSSDEM